MSGTADLPVPRMQLRWIPSTKKERRTGWCEVPGVEAWTCHYEMVLPLCRGDMRRGRKGDPEDDLLIVPMGKTTTLGDKPWHAPFRDDAHSRLDAKALGLPVYLIDTSGNASLRHAVPEPASNGHPTHAFEPHRKHPHFCAVCGYARSERVMRLQSQPTETGDLDRPVASSAKALTGKGDAA